MSISTVTNHLKIKINQKMLDRLCSVPGDHINIAAATKKVTGSRMVVGCRVKVLLDICKDSKRKRNLELSHFEPLFHIVQEGGLRNRRSFKHGFTQHFQGGKKTRA